MKAHLLHVLICCLLITVVFNGVWWIAIPGVFYYVLRYPAYELLLIGFCIDVYFAPTVFMWHYTIAALLLVLFGHFIRPRVRRQHSFIPFVS